MFNFNKSDKYSATFRVLTPQLFRFSLRNFRGGVAGSGVSAVVWKSDVSCSVFHVKELILRGAPWMTERKTAYYGN